MLSVYILMLVIVLPLITNRLINVFIQYAWCVTSNTSIFEFVLAIHHNRIVYAIQIVRTSTTDDILHLINFKKFKSSRNDSHQR